MFERYTKTARLVIFSARYIAGRVGSPEIETEHLLLGLQTRVRSIMTNIYNAIVEHDFTKARAFSDEEGKERDKLYLLYRKYGLTDWLYD
jgi:hypothetical protein